MSGSGALLRQLRDACLIVIYGSQIASSNVTVKSQFSPFVDKKLIRKYVAPIAHFCKACHSFFPIADGNALYYAISRISSTKH